MSNPKNMALATKRLLMNNRIKVRSLDEMQKTPCQMKTNSNPWENNRDMPNAALRRKIEERACHIWLENGCGHGDHERHCFEAERELLETAKQEREPRSDVRARKRTAKPH
jgi:hypothetical protein